MKFDMNRVFTSANKLTLPPGSYVVGANDLSDLKLIVEQLPRPEDIPNWNEKFSRYMGLVPEEIDSDKTFAIELYRNSNKVRLVHYVYCIDFVKISQPDEKDMDHAIIEAFAESKYDTSKMNILETLIDKYEDLKAFLINNCIYNYYDLCAFKESIIPEGTNIILGTSIHDIIFKIGEYIINGYEIDDIRWEKFKCREDGLYGILTEDGIVGEWCITKEGFEKILKSAKHHGIRTNIPFLNRKNEDIKKYGITI